MQADIIELLEKSKRPLGRKEIADELKESPIKVSIHLKQLIKYKEVKFVEIDRSEAMKLLNSKRRARLYYI